MIGAPGFDYGEGTLDDVGVAYVFLGPLSAATVSVGSADVLLGGRQVFDYAGSAVAGVGDFDGSGMPMIAVGAYGEDSGGAQAGGVFVIGGRGF